MHWDVVIADEWQFIFFIEIFLSIWRMERDKSESFEEKRQNWELAISIYFCKDLPDFLLTELHAPRKTVTTVTASPIAEQSEMVPEHVRVA